MILLNYQHMFQEFKKLDNHGPFAQEYKTWTGSTQLCNSDMHRLESYLSHRTPIHYHMININYKHLYNLHMLGY